MIGSGTREGKAEEREGKGGKQYERATTVYNPGRVRACRMEKVTGRMKE
jgi:hypothetical protein